MNKQILTITTSLTLITALISCSKNNSPKGYHLVWSDEFNGSKIDSSKWDFQIGTGTEYGLDHWGNNELQYYTDKNAFIENGNLIIELKKEDYNGESYTSSRLRTMSDDNEILFAKTYGRIEARIKLPKDNAVWPAFWMLPATNDYDVWASSGEIDILEAKGRLPNRVYGTVHFGQSWPGNKNSGGMYKFPAGTDMTEYHVYALDWEPGKLTWLVDETPYYETSQWWAMGRGQSEPYPYPAPYDKSFYILLNLAIGGNFDSGVNPDSNFQPHRMYVDYVRVYDKNEPYDTNVTKPIPPRDEKSFSTFKTNNGNFIFDTKVTETGTDAMTENEMDIHQRSWYFLALSDYEGKAISENKTINGDSYRCVRVQNPGNQNYSVQLIQHLPLAEGYTYRVEFDAFASKTRQISVKLGGDGDNSWAVYSPEMKPELTTEPRHFSYIFTMENKTDFTARLEFNMGLDTSDIYISNVSVTQSDM